MKNKQISLEEMIANQENSAVTKLKEDQSEETKATKGKPQDQGRLVEAFNNAELKNAVTKVLALRITMQQDEIIKEVARSEGLEVKALILKLVAKKAKDLGILK